MSAFEDAAREVHMEGYHEGANDGYRKALDDVLDLIDQSGPDEPLTVDDLESEVRQMRQRART